MANIGSMAVQLTAYTGKFDAAMKKSAMHVKMFGAVSSAITPRLAAFGASLAGIAAGYLSIRSVTRFIGGQMEAIDATAKLADSLGLTTEELSSFQYIANLAGVSSEQLATGFKMMLKNVGTGGMTPAQRFMQIADELMAIQDAGLRAQMTMKIFGKAGVSLLPMLAEGSQGMAEMSAEIERMGGLFDRVAGAQVEEANDSIARLQYLFKSVGNVLAVQVSPIIEDVSKRLLEWGTSGEGAAAKIVNAMEKAALAIAPIIDMMQKAQGLGKIASNAWAVVSAPGKLARMALGKIFGFGAKGASGSASSADSWSAQIRKYFDGVRDSSRKAAEESVGQMQRMNNEATTYGDNLEMIKERAKALADAASQTFRQGAIQTMAINTPVNRALFNQQLAGGKIDNDKRQTTLLEQIVYENSQTNRYLRDGITLKAQ